MTHEEELNTAGMECSGNPLEQLRADELSGQRKTITTAFRRFGLAGKVVRALRTPQVNCFDFTPGRGESSEAYQEVAECIAEGARLQLTGLGRSAKWRIELPSMYLASVTAGELSASRAARLRDKLKHRIYDIMLKQIDFDNDILGAAAGEIADDVMRQLGKMPIDTQKTEDGQSQDSRQVLLRAAKIVLASGVARISRLQRRLGLGYNKACAIMETLEKCGIVSPYSGNGVPRKILVESLDEAWKRILMNNSTICNLFAEHS